MSEAFLLIVMHRFVVVQIYLGSTINIASSLNTQINVFVKA